MLYINHKLLGISLITLTFSTSTAIAQTCAVPPDCTTLGFSMNTTDCVGKTTLKCPFDQNKVYCPSDNEIFQTYKLGDTYKVNGIAIGKIIQVNDCPSGVTVSSCIARSTCTTTTSDYVYDSNSSTGRLWTWTCKSTGALIATNYTGNSSDTARTCAYSISSCKNGGLVASIGTRAGSFVEAGKGCASVTAGGLTWYLPTNEQLARIDKYVGSFTGFVWDQSGRCSTSNTSLRVTCDAQNGGQATCTCGGYSWCQPCPNEIINNFIQGYFCVAAF